MTAKADFIKGSQRNQEQARAFISGKGLNPDLVGRYGLGYVSPSDTDLMELYQKAIEEDPGADGCQSITEERLVIPMGKDYFLLGYDLWGGFMAQPSRIATRENVFNRRGIYEKDGDGTLEYPVFICFDFLDALAYLGKGYNAIYLHANNLGELVEDLKRKPTDNTFIVATPRIPTPIREEEKERAKAEGVASRLKEAGVRTQISLQLDDNTSGETLLEVCRDAPDKFREIADIDTRNAIGDHQGEKERYLMSASGPSIEGFRERITRPNRGGIETGWKGLDELLGGGLYQGLYTIGALSSLGKTTFCLQLADQLAEKGQDVLFITMEESKDEMMARSISRTTYQFRKTESDARTYRDVLNGSAQWTPDQKASVFEAMKIYVRKVQDRIFFISKVEPTEQADDKEKIKASMKDGRIAPQDIESFIQTHQQYRKGSHPVVIIDYLQCFYPPMEKLSDKQSMDLTVSLLRKYSSQYEVPIIAISSFNRDAYNSPVSFSSFKESGAIEYGSDVIMALEPKGLNYTSGSDAQVKKNKEILGTIRNEPIREMDLVVLKNRHGRTGTAPFTFNAKYSFYWEGHTLEEDGLEDVC